EPLALELSCPFVRPSLACLGIDPVWRFLRPATAPLEVYEWDGSAATRNPCSRDRAVCPVDCPCGSLEQPGQEVAQILPPDTPAVGPVGLVVLVPHTHFLEAAASSRLLFRAPSSLPMASHTSLKRSLAFEGSARSPASTGSVRLIAPLKAPTQ